MILGLQSTTNLVIALSGASHSGKTTFMTDAQTLLGKDNVICISENIREVDIVKSIGIEKIRENPALYFTLQKKIITKKINQEIEASLTCKDKIILIDRSLADSIYYLTKYTEISKFPPELKKEYFTFLSQLQDRAQATFVTIYNAILIFPPIKKDEEQNDSFRQDLEYFNESQEAEFRQIVLLNEGIASVTECSKKIIPIDTMFQSKDGKREMTEKQWKTVCYQLAKQ